MKKNAWLRLFGAYTLTDANTNAAGTEYKRPLHNYINDSKTKLELTR